MYRNSCQAVCCNSSFLPYCLSIHSKISVKTTVVKRVCYFLLNFGLIADAPPGEPGAWRRTGDQTNTGFYPGPDQ